MDHRLNLPIFQFFEEREFSFGWENGNLFKKAPAFQVCVLKAWPKITPTKYLASFSACILHRYLPIEFTCVLEIQMLVTKLEIVSVLPKQSQIAFL